MKIRHRDLGESKAELQMTSMIDIVFLLLIFFIVTFKVSAQEGDFNVKMPLAAAGGGPPPDFSELPLKLRLKSTGEGQLAEIVLNDNLSFGTDFARLRQHVLQLIGGAGPKEQGGPEVEIDADYNLHYVHLIGAITAVTGQRDSENKIVRLIDRIKFTPPRK